MQRLIVLIIVAALGWYGYTKYQERLKPQPVATGQGQIGKSSSSKLLQSEPSISSPFKCDGRTYCSQMTSCAEATYFLKNCPGTKMDGNNDGIPCESQWCK
jgi:hypothetical protein